MHADSLAHPADTPVPHESTVRFEAMPRFQCAPHQLPIDAVGCALHLSELSSASLPSVALPPELLRSVPQRRLAYVGGRLCAGLVLRTLGATTHTVGRGTAGEPSWPDSFLGSITHTATLAVAVATPARDRIGIGIDSEPLVDRSGLTSVLDLCCTEHERRELFGRPDDRLVATLVFSVKEAFYKAVHRTVRRFVDFTEVEVHDIDRVRGHATLRPAGDAATRGRSALAVFKQTGDAAHTLVDLRKPENLLVE